jgi:hypothetical protein
MSTMPSHTQPHTQPEFSAASLLVKPSVETVAGHPAKVKNDQLTTSRSSLGKRASLAFAYYMIVFSVGIAATFGLADLWRRGQTADRANCLCSRSAAAQRYVA